MPTDTSVKFIHSAMTGAPSLTGLAGSLIALLDACLVNGFSAGNVDSIVIADGVATVTRSAGHPMEAGTVALIAGATVSGGSISGEQKVTAVTSTTYTFDAAGLADQTAGGTITHKVAPLGWAKPFNGTNLAAYRSTDLDATGCMLRVDDTSTTNARVVGYEEMTGIAAGARPFPTAAQINGGGYWPKSASADAVARSWVLCGDGRMVYLAVRFSTVQATGHSLMMVFGDPVAVKTPDAYACVLACATSGAAGGTPGDSPFEYDYGDLNAASGGLFMPRNYTGVGSSASVRKGFPLVATSATTARSGVVANGLTYPNHPDGGLLAAPHYLLEGSPVVIRARSPGLHCFPQSVSSGVFADLYALTGVSGLEGRVLRVLNSRLGCFAFDTTGPWR